MIVYSAVFHSGTVKDYNEAYCLYEEQQAGLGEKFLIAINDKVKKILANPEIFSVKSRTGYHEALVEHYPYSIVYRIDKKQKVVFIISIHHQKKHPRGKYRR